MATANRDALVVGSNTRPPMLFEGLFDKWKGRFNNFIDGKGEQTKYLWESFLNGPKISLHPDTGVVLKPYELQSEEAKRAQADIDSRSIIMQALPHDMYKSVSSLKSGKELLDEITRQQEGYSQSDQIKLDIALAMYEDYFQKPDEPLKECYRRFCEVINELKKVGVKKENQELNMNFLKKLNATRTPYGNNFRASKNTKKYNIHEVVGKLMNHQPDVLAAQNPKSNLAETSDLMALFVNKSSTKTPSNRSNSLKAKQTFSSDEDTYSDVDEEHRDLVKAATMFSKHLNLRRSSGGHFARECILPKRKDAEYYTKKMLPAQDAEKGKVLKASDDVWLNWSDSEQEPERANVVKLTNMNRAPDNVSSDDKEERPNDPTVQINVSIRDEPASNNHDRVLPELPDMYVDNFSKMSKDLRSLASQLYRTEQSTVVLAGHISNQTLFMNRPKDSFRENKGLGFENPLTLSNMAKAEPCLYDSRYLMIGLPARLTFASSSEVEEALAKRSTKMKREIVLIYDKINALYLKKKNSFSYESLPDLFNENESLEGQKHVVYLPTLVLEKYIISLEKELFENKMKSFDNERKFLMIIKAMQHQISLHVSTNDQLAHDVHELQKQIASQAITFCEMNSKEEIVDLKIELKGYKKHVALIEKDNIDLQVIPSCVWYLDSGCSRQMIDDKSMLTNYVNKRVSYVRFGNDEIATIEGYVDYVFNGVTIKRVSYVRGLGCCLFSVSQFCDSDLRVIFERSMCCVQTMEGDNLLEGKRESTLYSLAMKNMSSNLQPLCLVSKASSETSWLWHHRMSHLHSQKLNKLVSNSLVNGVPPISFDSTHVGPSCVMGKIHKSSHKSKTEFNTTSPLHMLHMDLCGPMHVSSLGGRKYILVIVDDYSRYT
ncbi:uncharacterized protein [Rutidosis leptorrhynchoides]|uniref:uncharacterized protein n=1 Tax=Rutidosis leptorrhynchoides TaxID=125765 RepID=UPI003A9986F4